MFRLFRYLKKVWWEVVLVMVLVAGQTTLQALLFNVMQTMTGLAQDPNADTMLVWQQIGIMVLMTVGIFALAVVTGLLNSHCAAHLGKKIRESMYQKVITISLGEYDSIGTASLITRTTNDIEQLKETYFMGVRTIIFAPITLVMAIVMTALNPLAKDLAYILLVSFALVVILIVVVFFVVSPLFNKIQESIDQVTLVFREGLTGVRVIRAFNQQPNEKERFEKANISQTNMIIKVGRTMAIIMPFVFVIFDFTYIFTYIFGFGLSNGRDFNNIVGIADIAAVAGLSMNVMNAFMMMAMVLISIPRAMASAKRINAVLDIDVDIKDPDMPVELTSITEKGIIEFRDVTFTFPDADIPTLKGLNFKTKPGTVSAIIGTTGSGKSSVINLIPRFYDVTDGEILLDGVDIRQYRLFDLRSKIGFVPQQTTLFSGTVRSNLEFGKENATEEEMVMALRVAQAEKFVLGREEGLDINVAQGGKNFSGGQKQRLSIARALIKKPEIYIFDDSFSALDFKTDIRLRKALRDYIDDSSIIIVAQRVASIIDADNIIVLQNGEIVGQGTHTVLLRKCKAYKDIVMSQMDPEEIEKTLQIARETLQEGGDF